MDPIAPLITPVLWLADRVLGWSYVRVRVHRAFFRPPGPPGEHYFINVVNRSPRHEIEITHIWFDTNPQVPVLDPRLASHCRLRQDEPFETYVPVAAVPDVPNVKRLGRVRLSSGKIVKSKPGNPPSEGYVPGSGSG